MKAQQIIQLLKLQKHIEGGYFKETYRSQQSVECEPNKHRNLMTVIYYLLTLDSPIDKWHFNTSDIMHFYQKGGSISYLFITSDRKIEKHILGQNIEKGEEMQLLVPGNCWKTCCLLEGQYCLISEAVAPGFDYGDMRLGEEEELIKMFPEYEDLIRERAGNETKKGLAIE